jgi:hypothetical protein
MGKLADFMAKPAPPLRGNTAWADKYAGDLRQVFHDYAARAPRSLQAHLGPSELGVTCHRQVAGKMARLPVVNHVADPWPSIRGTALHAWAAAAFEWHNDATGVLRWVAEQRVTPHPLHPGTADLYDAVEEAVVDHKFLGESSMDKVRSPAGPPRHYVVQLLLYGRGYRLLGLPVRRVALAAYPATAGSLAGMYVWERPHTPADDELLEQVFKETEYRRQWAIALLTGTAQLSDVPASGDQDECHFCPMYRPQTAKDGGPGCPGRTAAATP